MYLLFRARSTSAQLWIGRLTLAAIGTAAPAGAQTPQWSDDIHRWIPSGAEGPLAWGDLDADGDRDLLIGARLLANDGGGVFRDVACALPATDATAYALGDLDGDGDIDAVAGRDGADELWLNTSGCFLASPGALPAASGYDWTEWITLGDVDGDLDLDIVLANAGDECLDGPSCTPGEVRLFLNDGFATFTESAAPVPPGPDDDPRSVALGDVDGDGDLDLFVFQSGWGYHTGRHRLLENDGTGVFVDASNQIPVAQGGQPSPVHFFDFDGDGDLDLWFSGVILWRNLGTGQFQDASGMLPPLASPSEWCAIADVDGDTDEDVLVLGWLGADELLLNGGGGSFTLAPGAVPGAATYGEAVLLGDVDGDGDADELVVRSGGAELTLNDGAGAFAWMPPLLPSSGGRTTAFAVGDVDGDLDLDVLAGVEGQNQLFRNAGSGEFKDASAFLPADSDATWGAVLADVDADGDLDALFGNGGNGFGEPETLLLNDGTGQFQDASIQWPSFADRTESLAAADVDLDGDVDVLAGNSQGPSRLYFNDGDGNFAEIAGKWTTATVYGYSSAFGDVDGDGDPDAVIGGGGATVYANDGTGGFTVSVVLFAVNSITWGLAVGDVDGDLDLDIVTGSNFANGGGPTLRMFLNDGSGAFAEVTSSQLPSVTGFVGPLALGDVDQDGDADLLVFVSPLPIRVMLNDGDGSFTDAGSLPLEVDDFTHAIVIADLDQDQDADVLLGNAFARSRFMPNLRRQLAWGSRPRIGEPLTLDAWGTPGLPFKVYGSLAQDHHPFGGAGVLLLDRAQIFFSAGGFFDATGRASVVYDVPDDPDLIGASLYWQTLHLAPRKLGNLEITTFLDL